jgi:hypothetical protein
VVGVKTPGPEVFTIWGAAVIVRGDAPLFVTVIVAFLMPRPPAVRFPTGAETAATAGTETAATAGTETAATAGTEMGATGGTEMGATGGTTVPDRLTERPSRIVPTSGGEGIALKLAPFWVVAAAPESVRTTCAVDVNALPLGSY